MWLVPCRLSGKRYTPQKISSAECGRKYENIILNIILPHTDDHILSIYVFDAREKNACKTRLCDLSRNEIAGLMANRGLLRIRDKSLTKVEMSMIFGESTANRVNGVHIAYDLP